MCVCIYIYTYIYIYIHIYTESFVVEASHETQSVSSHESFWRSAASRLSSSRAVEHEVMLLTVNNN